MESAAIARRARVYHLVTIATALLQLAAVYLLARLLGPQGYDTWLLALASFALVHFLSQPGTLTWLVRRLGEQPGAEDCGELLATAAALLLGQTLLVAIALAAWALASGATAPAVALLLALAGIADLPRQLLWARLLAAGRHARVAALDLLIEVARPGGAALGAALGASALAAGLGLVGASALLAPLFLGGLRGLRPQGVPRRLGGALRDGLWLALNKNLTALGREVLPVVLLGRAPGVGQVALYRTTFRIVELPCRFLGGIFRVLLAHRDLDPAGGWRIGLRCGWIALAAGLLLAALAPPLAGWLLGREVDAALDLGLILALGNLFLGLGVALDVLYLARGALGAQARRNLVLFILAAALGWVAIPSGGALAAAALSAGFSAGTLVHWWRIRATW